jgi:hypothetical protein
MSPEKGFVLAVAFAVEREREREREREDSGGEAMPDEGVRASAI